MKTNETDSNTIQKNNNNKNKSRLLPQDKLMTVAFSPYIKGSETTSTIMADVIIATMPALLWGIYIFGFRALSLTVISVVSCVFFEFIYQLIMKKTKTVTDLSAVVTGILIAFTLPVNAPLWIPIAGGAFAIIIVKQLFGGIGKNIVNPAIAARIFLSISFPKYIAVFFDISKEKLSPVVIQPEIDALVGATPLTALKEGLMPSAYGFELFDMILGQKSGSIGEISAVMLLVGAVYLMIRKVITWHVPLSFIGTVAALAYFLPQNEDMFNFCLNEIFAGGLLLGAFFMATDYVTSPITKSGKLIFGIGCGVITIFIRYFGAYPEGVSFAIMIMNLFVWYIDKLTKPVKFGGRGDVKQRQPK